MHVVTFLYAACIAIGYIVLNRDACRDLPLRGIIPHVLVSFMKLFLTHLIYITLSSLQWKTMLLLAAMLRRLLGGLVQDSLLQLLSSWRVRISSQPKEFTIVNQERHSTTVSPERVCVILTRERDTVSESLTSAGSTPLLSESRAVLAEVATNRD